MSSSYVRDQVKAFITANLIAQEPNIIDLTGEFESIRDLVARYGLSHGDNWLGLQFIGSEELPISVSSTNTKGCYREIGAIYLHIVAQAKLGVANGILARSEIIRNTFRGQRIGDIVIEGVTPPNFEDGATLEFDGGYTAASVILNYERDLNL